MVSILLLDMHHINKEIIQDAMIRAPIKGYIMKIINKLLKKAPMKGYLTPINKTYNNLLEPVINAKLL